MLDLDFTGWDPPYTPLTGEQEYDDLERSAITTATEIKRTQWGDHIAKMDHKDGDLAYRILVEMNGISDGLLKVASSLCREEADYRGALRTWLKWYTNRSRREGWGLDPDAWILLTEIYTGLKDDQKARQMLVYAVTMVAAELDEAPSDLVNSRLLQDRSHQLHQLYMKVKNLEI